MKNPNSKIQQIAENSEQLQNTTRSNKLETRFLSSESDDDYKAEMLLIVADLMDKATLAEKMASAASWTRLTKRVIPLERLQDTFDYALEVHDSEFPITALLLNVRYKEMIALEKEEEEKRRAEQIEKEKARNCPDFHLHQSPTEALQEYFIGTNGYKWLPAPDAVMTRTGKPSEE